MAAAPIPQGYSSVTPYLIVRGAAAALAFYKEAFGAVELFRMDGPDGSVPHAEFKIGDSVIMMGEEAPGMGFPCPTTLGGTPVGLMIYVEDVDAAYPRAIAAGGTELRPLRDQFYGDRSGTLVDPFGHVWTLATHVEDVPHDELQRRMEGVKAGAGAGETSG